VRLALTFIPFPRLARQLGGLHELFSSLRTPMVVRQAQCRLPTAIRCNVELSINSQL
jgi:hypothetical protein